MLRRDFIKAGGAIFLPYFSFHEESEKTSLTFQELISKRKASYVSRGSGIYSKGECKGVAYTHFNNSFISGNNAVALFNEEDSCFVHLGKVCLLEWSLLNHGSAVNLRDKNSEVSDYQVNSCLNRLGVKKVERKIIDNDGLMTVAFDMDNNKIYAFSGKQN